MRLACSILVVLGPPACVAPDDDGPDDPEGCESIARACQAVAEASCEETAACCANGWDDERRDRCIAERSDQCTEWFSDEVPGQCPPIAEAALDECLGVVASAARTCVEWVDLGCGGLLSQAEPAYELHDPCSGNCGPGLVCSYGTPYSLVSGECEEGRCRERPGVGDPCEAGCGNCVDGLVCGADSRCKPPVPRGEVCGIGWIEPPCEDCNGYAWDDCESGSFCGPEGVCVTYLTVGEPCPDGRGCAGQCSIESNVPTCGHSGACSFFQW